MPTATEKANIANSLYCGPPRVRELVLLMARVRNSGIYFSQTSAIFLCRCCCPFYWGVRKARVDCIWFNNGDKGMMFIWGVPRRE